MNSLIISDRQKGKTKKLIEKCHADNYSLIVCPNLAMCKITFQFAIELGKPIPTPITFAEFCQRRFCAAHIDNFYFDELQMSLDMIANGIPIDTIVMDVTHSEVVNLNEGKV